MPTARQIKYGWKPTPLRNDPHVILKGFHEASEKLQQGLAKMESGSMRGMILAVAYLRADMDKTNPLIPVDYGNLRSSWFVVTAKSTENGRGSIFLGPKAGELSKDHASTMAEAQQMAAAVNQPCLIMGFTANYAMWVHEMLGDVKWQREGAGPRFFQAALERNKDKMLDIIAKNSKI